MFTEIVLLEILTISIETVGSAGRVLNLYSKASPSNSYLIIYSLFDCKSEITNSLLNSISFIKLLPL